jgi:hypothetical protein
MQQEGGEVRFKPFKPLLRVKAMGSGMSYGILHPAWPAT